MVGGNPSGLHRQISRVSRRLFLQVFLNCLAWCWAVALVVAAVWFVVQPLLVSAGYIQEPREWVRWAVAGGALTLMTGLATLLARRWAPSKLSAALSLDEKFGLKERVTTSFTLTPEQQATSVGQALLEDMNQRIEKLDVSSRFPIRLTWKAALVPILGSLLAIVAVFWNPDRNKVGAKPVDPTQNAENVANPDKKAELRKAQEKRPADKPKSENVEKIEAELEKIARKQSKDQEQAREQMKALTDLENKVKDQEKALADKQQSLQQQLKQLDQMTKDSKEGPAKDLKDALAKGDMNQAKEEMDRLAKKLKDNELSEKEKEQLKKQLEDVQDKLERLAKQKDKEEQLKQLHEEGKLDAETLQRELDNLKKDSEKLKDLQELSDKLEACKECMEKGDGQGASEKLQQAGDKLKQMDLDDQELKDLREQLQRVQECKGECNGQGQRNQNSDNASGQGQANGRRAEGKDSQYGNFEAKQKGEFDTKGQKIHDGYLPGQNFKKKGRGIDLDGDIEFAKQEAPHNIEQQRIPKAARDMAKGYFQNLGGQKEKEKEKKDKP